MVEIIARESTYKVLEEFVKNEPINLDAVLDNADIFKLCLHYNKYPQSVNLPAAKIIVNTQVLVYRIGALLKYDTTDIRRLTKAEKEQLEIPFEVINGSTEISADMIEQVKGIMDMIPDAQRVYVAISLIIAFFGYMSYRRYLDYKEKHDVETERTKLFGQAIDKLGQANTRLAGLVTDYEKDNLSCLAEVDEEVEYQGVKYTSEEIRNIKRFRFPRKSIEIPEARRLEGNYRVISINLEQKFINIKNGDDVERVYYAEDLLNVMQNFKAQFKDAIDNEGKIFYIEAGYMVRNGKKSPLHLIVMRPA